ncbi:ADP-ribosyl cyclase/cyclic ADP-ribose hydrolase 2-like isoform X2 [Hirundo rustica]|uniref:ADP-ribosyl cyclase/cyclic ADP-ribose hydrolase 2-like isoform X2 n=1 Tax=Hirundo rustica TaxID=43150 RepID=UPI001A9413DB|nr:ADP-ribosyl cyclase/cyclic ADP-ribose hydrolase 2-like isoform X2 [Hirundo rustica]
MMSLFFPLLFVPVLCMNSFSGVQGRKWKGEGTTQNLESIIIGRCYDYIRILNPAVGEKNCSQIWEAFKNAFISKDPCNILPKDYELFINLTLHTIPPNKSIFWENNQLLVNSFADRGRRYMSVSDTLFGFVADFLNWCGQADSPGLDYESCPTTMECENNPVESFWRMASITYAQRSSGVIQVLLNGSADGGAYPQPGDSCGTNSVKTLETRLKTLGYDVTCTDNYKSVMFLLCLDNPDDSKCSLASSAPAAQRGPISSDRGGSWNKLMFVSFAGFLFRFALVY